jgi:SAM-dependent methyltransferase
LRVSAGATMMLLFACTLFLSSSLLFLVQPMMAKMILPLLGGTPAVWNTCMVFFQATLLLGYLYVHTITRWLRFRQQALLHAVLLVGSMLTLPIVLGAHADPPQSGMPILWLARLLLFTVGFPFFVVSTSGPLLQRWFARTDHPAATDPYFLSVAGNLGSIVALLAYPAGFEPQLRLADQSWVWAASYSAFAALMLVCGAAVVRRHRVGALDAFRATSPERGQASEAPPPTTRDKIRWIALAFVPSSLMLGLTTYLTTDVAPVPLFWVLPLSLYLLSFVLVFARREVVSHALMLRLLPIVAIVLVTVILFAAQMPPILQAPLHLITFFAAAMVCHGELARARPRSEHLTEFYLLMSVGGVLGGLFNALVAPIAFTTVVEYPLAIVLACVARPGGTAKYGRLASSLDVAVPIGFGVLMLVMMNVLVRSDTPGPVAMVLLCVIPAVVCFSFKKRPLRFALSLGALMIASSVYVGAHEPVAFSGRSYFSVYRVMVDPPRHLRMLVHGRIVHGAQSLDPARAAEPLTYYHRTGPIGQAFATFHDAYAKPRVAVVGLGTGTLAAYAEPRQVWTFYEIDPSIATLARDPRYFTYLRDARTAVRIVLGDARLSLTREPARGLDLLVVDAFGSDAIPVHLLTREALTLYFRTLDQHGVLAYHISNRYMDLQPLLGDLGADAGFVGLGQVDEKLSRDEEMAGKNASSWVLMARSAEDLGSLTRDPRWHPLMARPRPIVWTDDFSNPLSVMRWF